MATTVSDTGGESTDEFVTSHHAPQHANRPSKRRRCANGSQTMADQRDSHRRQAACNTCRLRKVKCDKGRPTCTTCTLSNSRCDYPRDSPEKLTLEVATRTLTDRLDKLQDDIAALKHTGLRTDNAETPSLQTASQSWPYPATESANQSDGLPAPEPSRDFLQIPACKTSADAILEWEIFGAKYPQSSLVGPLFLEGQGDSASPTASATTSPTNDTFNTNTVPQRPDDEQIPSLIDQFLQNVHTKNPILDVENLVKHGRRCAEQGIGWDGMSCLVLLACALGFVGQPFGTLNAACQEAYMAGAASRSSKVATAHGRMWSRNLRQGDSCFTLACRRLGLLSHTLIGAQSYFFAGVYLMYTLRPIKSWEYFFHASVLYRMYIRTTHGISGSDIPLSETLSPDADWTRHKIRRMEQSLYWSCFKSESEFRVELPLPQSELSTMEFPNLFPSPPSPMAGGTSDNSESNLVDHSVDGSLDEADRVTAEEQELRQHAKRLCSVEESWYYYLTEIALHRIGNQIINTFFCPDRSHWRNIQPLLRLAQVFEAQVSSWSAHLPPSMQHYETAFVIRAPHLHTFCDEAGSHVSRELSWAVDNRLLEMQTWLYQPFLYYLIHFGIEASVHSQAQTGSNQGQVVGQSCSTHDEQCDNSLDPLRSTTMCPSSPTLNFRTACEQPGRPQRYQNSSHLESTPSFSPLDDEDLVVLRCLIASGIECNLKTISVRSLGHRHHGLWFDLRSTMSASLILLAIVRSGHAAWIPGGVETVWGPDTLTNHKLGKSYCIGGEIAKVLAQLEFWAAECPSLHRCKDVLEDAVRDTIASASAAVVG